MHTTSILVLEVLIPLFLWAIGTQFIPTTFPYQSWAAILSFPILLPLLVFARHQYTQNAQQKQELEKKTTQQVDTTLFVSTFLKPKLKTILEMSEYPVDNKENIQKQLTLVLEETEIISTETEKT